MILVGDNIVNSTNIGGLLRLADAFAIEKVVFTGNILLDTRKVKKVSRNTHRSVNWEIANSTSEVVKNFKKQNVIIYGLEIHESSIKLEDIKVSKNENIALVVGNEQEGLSEAVINLCDKLIYIPMLGKNHSMNVTSATAIALYNLKLHL